MDSHIARVTERDFWEMPELVEELVLLLDPASILPLIGSNPRSHL